MNKRLIEASQLLGTIVPLLENSSIELLIVKARDGQNQWVEFELNGSEAKLRCWVEEGELKKTPGLVERWKKEEEVKKYRAKRDGRKQRKIQQSAPVRNISVGRRQLMSSTVQPHVGDKGYEKYELLVGGDFGCLKCPRVLPTEQGARVHYALTHGPKASNRLVKKAVVVDAMREAFAKSLDGRT